MEKIQYIDPTGTVYPSKFITNRCNFEGFKTIEGEEYEVYSFDKKGNPRKIYVQRIEVTTIDLPHGFYYENTLKERAPRKKKPVVENHI